MKIDKHNTIILIFSALVLLTGCGKADSKADTDQSEIGAYKELLTEKLQESGSDSLGVALIDLNSDDIYELAIIEGDAHNQGAYLYTYKDGKAISLNTDEFPFYGEYGSFSYNPGNSKVFCDYETEDTFSEYYFNFEKDALKLEHSLRNEIVSFDDNEHLYYLDDEAVSEEEYDQTSEDLKANFFNSDYVNVYYGACSKVSTIEDIEEALSARITNTGEEKVMGESNNEVVTAAQFSEADREAFASGIATKEAGASATLEKEPEQEFVLNNEIEERCPVTFTANRSDVEYGEFSHATYFSETCGLERGYSILLPADYSEDKQYPVLYLLHGIFGDEYSFSGDASNKIKEIVGNMAAEGLIEETIVVCPNMYATSDPDQKPAFDNEACLPYDNFINDLVNDLMPHIESTYSVLTGRENTYLAGFSMGGRETIYITLQKPELFGYVCAISAAPGVVPSQDKFMSHEGQLIEDEMRFKDDQIVPNVFIICCGTRDSVVGKFPKTYHELLEKNGSDHIWYEITGADHDNNAIKSGLYNLLKQIAFDKA